MLNFQMILPGIISLFVTILSGKYFIDFMRKWQKKGQPIREEGPATHHIKAGTPTMGGLLFFFVATLVSTIFCDLHNSALHAVCFISCCYFMLGFADDYFKICKFSTAGLSAKSKLLFQSIAGLLVLYYLWGDAITKILLPFFGWYDLGYLYIPFALFVIIGSSNAVNLTDGLDGLLTVPVIFNLLFFICVAISQANNEIVILCLCFVGSLIGFLWYNAYPAQIFMGDVGSLSLGGLLAILSIVLKCEIYLAITGLLFVIETLSVMIQVVYFKYSDGGRIFLMAPIHHHFEKMGLHEVKIVIRAWIFALLTCSMAWLLF